MQLLDFLFVFERISWLPIAGAGDLTLSLVTLPLPCSHIFKSTVF